MTAQEILEGITRHRANPLKGGEAGDPPPGFEIERKANEIEWALQALAEKLVEVDSMIDRLLTVGERHAELADEITKRIVRLETEKKP